MLQSESKNLTSRELEIAKLILQSKSNKIIAQSLGISIRTVETHRKNTFKKLNCNSAMDLMRWAVKQGIEIEEKSLNF